MEKTITIDDKPKEEKEKRTEYSFEERPMSAIKLCKAITLWIALDLKPTSFSESVARDMLGKYYCSVKKQQKDPHKCLSDKQYSLLYHIYSKFKINECFDFETIKFLCVDISAFGTLEITSRTGQLCSQFYFETKEDGIMSLIEFKDKYKHLIKHHKYMTQLPPTQEEEFD